MTSVVWKWFGKRSDGKRRRRRRRLWQQTGAVQLADALGVLGEPKSPEESSTAIVGCKQTKKMFSISCHIVKNIIIAQ